jgi:hypothetical protein
VISSLVSRFDLVLIDIAPGLRFARCCYFSLGFGPAMKQAVGSSLALVELPLDFLARFSKIDDVTHPAPLLVTRYLMMEYRALTFCFGVKYALSVAIAACESFAGGQLEASRWQ